MAKLPQSTPTFNLPYTADDFLHYFNDKMFQITLKILNHQLSFNVTDQGLVSLSTSPLSQFKPISSEALAS